MRRTSRWASTPSTELATRKGSTPMSMQPRQRARAASLVCSVLNTRCPVSEAWTAVSAVSLSRISPTMTTSGSWRRIDRSPPRSQPDLGVHLDLVDAGDVVLDRVLDGDALISSETIG
jgi:hypothetical protein